MSYKILKQTDKAFQIAHPDGSTFTVPKRGLSKSMMDKIEKLPGFADGGPVSPDLYMKNKEIGAMSPEARNERAMKLMSEAQAAQSPADVRYYPGAKPYADQPTVKGAAPVVEESPISPIDFLTPGMVAAPVKALGRGAAAIGREAIEAAPRILGNEIGAIGKDLKSLQNEGFIFKTFTNKEGDKIRVNVIHPEKGLVGSASFRPTANNTLTPVGVNVEEGQRRKGIATAMYDLAKQHSGIEQIEPSTIQTPEAKKFWESYGSVGRDVKAELPMDEASRVARAKEMGFNTDKTYFHSTKRDFDEFNPKAPMFGENRFNLIDEAKEEPNRGASFFSEDPKATDFFITDFENNNEIKKGARTIPVFLKDKNVFDYENPEHLKKLDEAFKNESDSWGRSIIPSEYIKHGHWEEIEKPRIQREIKNLGFDGFFVKEGGKKNIGIYKPEHIRSKFAEFDPSKAKSGKISYAHGGIVGEGKNMSYRIIKDAEDHYQVLHPDGSKFTVPKKGISKQMHEKISGMPKLYNGDDEISLNPSLAGIEPPKSMTMDEFNQRAGISDEIPVNLSSSTRGLERLDKAKESIPSEMPIDFMPGPKLPPTQKELEEMAPSREIKYPEEKIAETPKKEPTKDQEAKTIEGIDQTAMPQMQAPDYLTKFDPYASFRESQKAAKTLENAQLANQKMLDQNAADFETSKANEHKEMQNFIDTHQIRQGNYWGSMDTGGKVMAGLAMALGGLGAGMTGGPNYALQIINKAIEDDLDAQKENRNSGLTALLQKGKDRDAVMANYRANLIQKVQDQNNLYTAQAKTADQKAAGQALDMKLQEMKTQYQVAADNKLAMNYLYRKGLPTKAIPFSLLNDEKVRRQLVNVNGTSYFYKGGPEGAEIHNKMEANYRPIKEGILRLKELGRESLVPGTKAYEEAQALSQMLPNAVAGFYSAAIESKRISDTEGHRAEAALSNPTSIMQAIVGGNVRGMTALREMNGIVDSSRQQNLAGYDATPEPVSTGLGDGKVPLNKGK